MPAPRNARQPASPPPADPEPQTDPGAADSSTGSSDASTNGGGGFFADPGPAFDPDSASGQPPPEPEIPSAIAEWTEPVVGSLLDAQGQATHYLIGKAEDDFVWLPGEKRAAVPPLTRILNRYDATRAAAAAGDELALIIAVAGYAGRSVMARHAAIVAQRAEQQEDVLGAPVFDDAVPPIPDVPPTPWRP